MFAMPAACAVMGLECAQAGARGSSPEGRLVVSVGLAILRGARRTAHVALGEARRGGVHGLAKVGLGGETALLFGSGLALLGKVVVEAHGQRKLGGVELRVLSKYVTEGGGIK